MDKIKLIILTLFLYTSTYGYSSTEKFTAQDAVNLSADAYLEPSQFNKIYHKNSDKIWTSEYNYVRFYIIEKKDQISIVFRGTDSSENLKTDVDMVSSRFLNISGTKVHNGFYQVALKSKKILKKVLKKNKPIYVTGHSLGGAISILLGAILQKDGYDVKVYTFGAPPVGNKMFIKYIKGLKHYRYLHDLDLMSNLDKNFLLTLKDNFLILRDFIREFEQKIIISDQNHPKNHVEFHFAKFLDNIEKLLININYKYIHDKYKTIHLQGSVEESKEYETLPFWIKLLVVPIKYHSIYGYQKNINNISSYD